MEKKSIVIKHSIAKNLLRGRICMNCSQRDYASEGIYICRRRFIEVQPLTGECGIPEIGTCIDWLGYFKNRKL